MARCPRLVWDDVAQDYVARRWRGACSKKRKVVKRDRKLSPAQLASREKRIKLAAMLAAGMPERDARVWVGFSAENYKVCKEVFVQETVADMRARLQGTEGLNLPRFNGHS